MEKDEMREVTEVVGRYELYGEIASGGMATVHFGRMLGAVGFSRPVAIKRMHPHLARDPNLRAMFIDEARLVARIAHPNVVPTLDIVSGDNHLLLVMEYVHGESLSVLGALSRRAGVPIPLPIVLAILSNVLHGLHAAHEARTEDGEPLEIVHRDLSPHNILVGADGSARILDFGIARANERLETTREGVLKGKLAYMAPEQLDGSRVSRRCDVFTAGIVLWELCANRRMFMSKDGGERFFVEKLMRGDFESPGSHGRAIPAALDAIVMKALARDPAERHASAREMALAIEGVCGIATASEVGAWIHEIAGSKLATRAARLAQLERSSYRVRASSRQPLADSPLGLEPVDITLDVDLAEAEPPGSRSASEPSRLSDTANSLSPSHVAAPRTLVSDLGAAGSVEARRLRRRLLGAAFATAAVAAGVVGVQFASRFAGGNGAQTIAALGVAAREPATATPSPAPPPCPAGMARIPGGRFFMGSDDDLPMEKPAHNVTLSPYCIDTKEVTTGDYKACSDDGGCKRAGTSNHWEGITAEESRTYDPMCNVRDPFAQEKHPINCVDWEMASTYCKAQNKRLPTEAEWEFAARGPDGRKYPWGDEEPNGTLLNACGAECLGWAKRAKVELGGMYPDDDGFAHTAPVGSFPRGASPYGILDMVGNVWEWVGDFYHTYSKEDAIDPTGPAAGDKHVIRGGAWNGAYTSWVRPTFRYKDSTPKRSYGIGFRCAAALHEHSGGAR